jgi:hypothetical protein
MPAKTPAPEAPATALPAPLPTTGTPTPALWQIPFVSDRDDGSFQIYLLQVAEAAGSLVPNAIVVSRGCPHQCDFCYKEAFFKGGRGFYTQTVDAALAEMERLPGRHLYFPAICASSTRVKIWATTTGQAFGVYTTLV